ncbi:CTP synthase (glutamine hydrolyzing) [Candidatus Woesearchaeota archaeon]|nr:CTP synthase (glutamine hydrolyzing) [Candidatus Woesearchaeota archaeon]
MVKYIVVTGGVLSGLGKGVAAASIGHLLSYDYKVVPIKCDGYLNVDPGTMNPIEHGEVFVLDDGTEVDMDFGHYERFLNTTCNGRQNLTMGKVFHELYEKERKGEFLGKTVQLVPHASGHIVDWWKEVAKSQDADVALVEIGGTVGDMENELYLEAARSLRSELGKENVMFVHLTYIPIPGGVNEQKSKPTQQSVSLLMQRGISPDAILCRSREQVSDSIKRKISMFCNVPQNAVIGAPDVTSVYSIPKGFYEQDILTVIKNTLGLDAKPDLTDWTKRVNSILFPTKKTTVAICGKYTALEDSYASVVEALHHAGAYHDTSVEIKFVDTENVVDVQSAKSLLSDIDAVIVPGGFGSRGIEGKINAVRYCRENNIPYLGLCYGLQLAVIELMRNVCGHPDAHTTEVNPDTTTPIVDILPDQKNVTDLGGTLRLGAYPAILSGGSLAEKIYDSAGLGVRNSLLTVSERHRHRYEVNPKYHKELIEAGLKISGLSPDGRLAEFIELPTHKFFMATQAHPELKSSLQKPAPLFVGLVGAAKKY